MEGEDVQIVSVKRGRSGRKRKHASSKTDDVICIESFEFPEVSLVELPPDDVEITGVSRPPRKRRKATERENDVLDTSVEIIDDAPTVTKKEEKSDDTRKDKKSEPESPAYWTKCDKCGSVERRYHLIEVKADSHEWFNVCSPLLREGFFIQRLMRIQNQMLWHRLQCERELMYKTHSSDFDLNERLLYHTSRAEEEVICAEGLDQRLGCGGNFGRGIYFSDNPRKCDGYWRMPNIAARKMFACRVLLGDIKVYPKGHREQFLVREPPKPSSTSDGQTSNTYDSVLGCMNFNEFVVYNTYRVMPEYVIEYQMNPVQNQVLPIPCLGGLGGGVPTPYAAHPSLPMCHVCGGLTNSRHCVCKS